MGRSGKGNHKEFSYFHTEVQGQFQKNIFQKKLSDFPLFAEVIQQH